MPETQNREHYIPLRRGELVDLLASQPSLEGEDRLLFRQFCEILTAGFHFHYHRILEDLKEEYAYFDPDTGLAPSRPLDTAQREERVRNLFDRFGHLMQRANFVKLDKQAIDEAIKEVSDWGLNMEVDWDVFERLDIYVRGDTTGLRSRKHWWKWWQIITKTVPVFHRLALIMKLRQHKRIGKDVDTQDVFLKLFKDIPKMDLEMLLPGARLQMPNWTRLKLGGSILSGLVFVLYRVIRDVFFLAQAGLGLLWGPAMAVAGYGYKQWYGFQSTKTTYSLQLTQSLYFQNLDNNLGVMVHLLDEAEEQECREAILGYYYLWKQAPEGGWTAEELDRAVEQDLHKIANLNVDFEIHDALEKLERLKIVSKVGERYSAQPVMKALEILDHDWDGLFRFNTASHGAQPVGLAPKS